MIVHWTERVLRTNTNRIPSELSSFTLFAATINSVFPNYLQKPSVLSTSKRFMSEKYFPQGLSETEVKIPRFSLHMLRNDLEQTSLRFILCFISIVLSNIQTVSYISCNKREAGTASTRTMPLVSLLLLPGDILGMMNVFWVQDIAKLYQYQCVLCQLGRRGRGVVLSVNCVSIRGRCARPVTSDP